MLQTRVGKRTGVAAVRIAVDMVKEDHHQEGALQRIGPDQLAQYLYPIFDAKEESHCTPSGRGCRLDRELRRKPRVDGGPCGGNEGCR